MTYLRSILLVLIVMLIPVTGQLACAQQQNNPAEPTREQLELQISIMRDYIKKLEQNAGANAELQAAYIQAKKKEYQYMIAAMDLNIAAYQTARIASDVILGLVCLVVIAGILFAGFQLWKSVSVAGVQATNDLELSASKVRVTSSVVGVVVLIISLALLYIYTKEIYGVTIVAPPSEPGSSQPSK
jgi:hypothetical protein